MQEGALELLDLLLDEYPSPIELEMGYLLRARCLESLGRLDDAVDSYHLAFQARRSNPSIRTYAPLEFGMFAIRQVRVDLYPEVQSAFNELVEDNDLIFPDAQYMYFAANAMIAHKYGQKEMAQVYAKKALQAADIDYSGSGRHPKLGLVEEHDENIERKLRKILNPGLLTLLNHAARN